MGTNACDWYDLWNLDVIRCPMSTDDVNYVEVDGQGEDLGRYQEMPRKTSLFDMKEGLCGTFQQSKSYTSEEGKYIK